MKPAARAATAGAKRCLGAAPLAAALGLLLATGGLSACGLRTPVRPPEATAPVIPGTVSGAREDGAVVLRWKRAERSADGQRLEDLAAFVIERKREGETAWTQVGEVDVVDQEKIRRRRDFEWRDADPGASPAAWRVRAVCADGQRGPASTAVFTPDR